MEPDETLLNKVFLYIFKQIFYQTKQSQEINFFILCIGEVGD
ncbi:hypothetical protein [Streptococcus himalayensis]|nr:hypothetical protein [Streptococcus himalayensis]